MKRGPIEPMPLAFAEPREAVRLPAVWICGDAPAALSVRGAWLKARGAEPRSVTDDPMLTFLGPDEVESAVLSWATAGKRVYGIVGPGWGAHASHKHLAEAPRVLLRRVAEVPATAAVVRSSARIRLCDGADLRLDADQAAALRHSFLRLFWHDATEEAWSVQRRFVWRPAAGRPYDVPMVPVSALVRWEAPDARLEGAPVGALMHLTAGPPPEVAPDRLWFPPGPTHHETLAALAGAGAEVVWDDLGLPDLRVGGDAGEALFTGVLGRLRLRLNAGQASALGELLRRPTSWRFGTGVRLGDPELQGSRFWLPGAPAARPLEDVQTIEVGDVQAPALRDLDSTRPASLPAANPLALAALYTWTAVPPRLPRGSEEAPLVRTWRELDAGWKARLGELCATLAHADTERSRIGRAFERLLGAMLGFERTRAKLLERVEALEATPPSASGPDGAPMRYRELDALATAVAKLCGDLDAAERKEIEDREREAQEVSWRRDVERAASELPALRKALRAREAEEQQLETELRAIKAANKPKDAPANKDHKVKLQRAADDLKRARRDVIRLSSELDALQSKADEVFVFEPPQPTLPRTSQKGGSFIPSASSASAAPTVPEEALPVVGALRVHNSDRYLVIDDWEQLAQAEVEAARLAAHLVGPEAS